ncbi:SDR family NAD(P)-dependent oxidoreductase [Salinicola tamaricis]|uniref:SDR family NAD(P)-dependent oxidoreductase n=1 Tax=Salinicola tamaricis TaxID=1771309 RepID=UPI000D0A662F|nr:SDR family NAD(P)-dependent oxidoreductase [Salinicola tamaricis]
MSHANTPHIDQRVAIVTGGSRGIGHAVSLKLAADGFAVVVNYAGNTRRAEETVAEIEAAGGRALAVQADIADPVAGSSCSRPPMRRSAVSM